MEASECLTYFSFSLTHVFITKRDSLSLTYLLTDPRTHTYVTHAQLRLSFASF